MATHNTDIAEKQSNFLKTSAERQDDGAKVSGDVLFATAVLTIDGTEVNTDTVNIVKLPEGATVIPHLCKVVTDFSASPDTDMDITVGDDDDTTAADADRYSTTLTIDDAGAGQPAAFDFAAAAAWVNAYTLQKQSWITATLSGIANLAATDTITFLIAYRAQS